MEEQRSTLKSAGNLAWHTENAEQKHSKLGIASFIIAIICVLSLFALFVVAGMLESSGGIGEEAAMIVGALFFLFIILCIISIGLGIAGLIVKGKKVFAVLGLVFSVGIFLLSIFLIILGLSVINNSSDYYNYDGSDYYYDADDLSE
ncbi:MAG: hypothetical protein LBP40_05345 [Campylobacteraceae bacterium]|jgi:hypothetical protein|nr:hypothetical protein [Campylobacteraceae bacterium]